MNKFVKIFDRKNIKPVLMYLLMVLLYVLLNRNFIIEKTSHLIEAIIYATAFLLDKIIPQDCEPDFFIVTLALFGGFLFCYTNMKICGLFKRLKGLNFFLSLLILIIVDINVFFLLHFHMQLHPLKFSYDSSYIDGIFFPTAIMFFIYKFFHFLGGKFPNTFGKIGYWTSIEFYRELFVRVKKNFRWY